MADEPTREDLDDELQVGALLARQLVEHLECMGAASLNIPIRDYEVIVRLKPETMEGEDV